MKRLLLIASVLFASGAQAAQVDWKTQLEDYKQHISTLNNNQLVLRTAYYSVMAAGTCAASAAMTASAFIADSAPITGVVAEIIANNADPSYQTWDKILTVETLANTTRGALGGGVVGVAEALEFVNLWLGGNTDQAFGQLKKAYSSSFATMDALFADKGQCLMNFSKVLLTRREMQKRGEGSVPAPLAPFELRQTRP